MHDLNAAPFRAQTEAAGRERSVVPLHGNPMPADPAAILAKTQPKDMRGGKGRLVLWSIVGLVAAQLFAPPALKPTVIAGGAAADFYGQIMVVSQQTQEKAAHQNGVAQRLAAMEADYADARAKCFWGALVGPEAGELCVQLVDANFVPAIRQLQAELAQ